MVNKVILIGNVGIDPEIRTTEGGVKVARIRLATTERLFDRQANEAKEPSPEVVRKLSEYFGVSPYEVLEDLPAGRGRPTLTERERRDVAREVERIMGDLENSGDLMFDGVPMSPEARDSLTAAMKLGLEAARLRNKETYTPKKYRGPKEEA